MNDDYIRRIVRDEIEKRENSPIRLLMFWSLIIFLITISIYLLVHKC